MIGSPLFELGELAKRGWAPIYLDVRTPPIAIPYIRGDATDLHAVIGDASWAAISTNCVVCHAGMGRYGDPKRDQGDEMMMAELFRILAPGGRLAITFGPVVAGDEPIVQGNAHRIFTVGEARRMAVAAGFVVLDMQVFNTESATWRPPGEPPVAFTAPRRFDYLSALLERPASPL